MGFRFEYVGLASRATAMGCGHWVGPDHQQWNLLGRIAEGKIELGAAVLLPTASGVAFRGIVARFAESFSLWEGLPFYNVLTAEMMPGAFCLCVGGTPGEHGILCPGIATSEDPQRGATPDRRA